MVHPRADDVPSLADSAPLAPSTPATLAPAPPRLVRLTEWMNRGTPKRFWTAYVRLIGARLVQGLTSRVLRVHGLEHFRAASPARPILLVANHRTFFDMFVVSSVIFRRVPGPWRFFFPVRARYCYQSARGALLNCLAAGWAMYPPFFREPGTRDLDRLMLGRLIALLREGEGHVVGFHPEGTRNQGNDPYQLLPAHPGVGQLVLAARPQVIPVFVAGLVNDPRAQWRANRPGGEMVRVHFGPVVPDDAYASTPARARGYQEVSTDLMRRIAELAAEDRRRYSPH